jgi:hypothetical protein
MKKAVQGPRHLFIPDLQVKPGSPTEHIAWAARYAAIKQPDVIVQAGDWFDFPSLSSYDVGKKAAEGRRYQDDIDAGNRTLALFDSELKKNAPKGYSPRKLVTLGNHEDRVNRAVEADAKLAGKISFADMQFAKYGWEVFPFLERAVIHGITYAHFCPLNSNGTVTNGRNGAPSALAQARRMMTSTVCGHRQGLDTATVHTPSRTIRGVIAGSYYMHSEGYLTAMGQNVWHGVLIFNDIQQRTGEFDLCEVSLKYLRRRFG